jgi:hypothetical protein
MDFFNSHGILRQQSAAHATRKAERGIFHIDANRDWGYYGSRFGGSKRKFPVIPAQQKNAGALDGESANYGRVLGTILASFRFSRRRLAVGRLAAYTCSRISGV